MKSPPAGPNNLTEFVADGGASGILPEREAGDRHDDKEYGRQGRGGIEGDGSAPAQGIVGNEAGYRSLQDPPQESHRPSLASLERSACCNGGHLSKVPRRAKARWQPGDQIIRRRTERPPLGSVI
jgi:hypothetical protein